MHVKWMPLVLLAGLALSMSRVRSSESASNPARSDSRRTERALRGHLDKDSERMEREQREIEEQPGGRGGKYLRREQAAAAKEQRRLMKESNEVVKVKKHHSSGSSDVPPE